MDDDITTLSLDEMDAVLTRDAGLLSIYERELATARGNYAQHVESHAFRDVPEVAEALEAQWGTPLREAERNLADRANTVHGRALAVRDATKTAQLSLTDDEWRAAETRRETIREDVEMLSPQKLVEMAQFALLRSDRPAMYHLHRYIPNRVAAGERDGDRLSRIGDREKSELRRLVAAIADKLKDPALAPVNERALDMIGRAGKVRHGATERQRKEERKAVPYAFQGANDVPRWEE